MLFYIAFKDFHDLLKSFWNYSDEIIRSPTEHLSHYDIRNDTFT